VYEGPWADGEEFRGALASSGGTLGLPLARCEIQLRSRTTSVGRSPAHP
jgi:hypothetical protein